MVHQEPKLRQVNIEFPVWFIEGNPVSIFDDDIDFCRTLPLFIDTYTSIEHISLRAYSQRSLLDVLIKAENAAFIQRLSITYNPSENLELLQHFTGLKRITFHTYNEEYDYNIQEFAFSHYCPSLEQYEIISAKGGTYTVTL